MKKLGTILVLGLAATGCADQGDGDLLDVRLNLHESGTILSGSAEVSTDETREAEAEARAAATDYLAWQNAEPQPANLPENCTFSRYSDDEPSAFAQDHLPLPEANLASGTLRLNANDPVLEFTDEEGDFSQLSDGGTFGSDYTLEVVGDGDFAAGTHTISFPQAPSDYDISMSGDIVTVTAGATPIDVTVGGGTGFVGFGIQCDELVDTTFTFDVATLGYSEGMVSIPSVGVDEIVTIDVGPNADGRVVVHHQAENGRVLREQAPGGS